MEEEKTNDAITEAEHGLTPEEEAEVAPTRARLIEVLESLEEQIARQTSLKWVFLRGAIYGLGTVIGATVLLALLGGIVATTLSSLADTPFVGDYIGDNDVEEYVEELPE